MVVRSSAEEWTDGDRRRTEASHKPGGTDRAVITSVSVTSICLGTRQLHIARPSLTGTFLLMMYSPDHLREGEKKQVVRTPLQAQKRLMAACDPH